MHLAPRSRKVMPEHRIPAQIGDTDQQRHELGSLAAIEHVAADLDRPAYAARVRG
ncbi:hypothetical protein PAT3040_02868 [Paenibacillus agaridevorans]|uniref:Uncharacterized protein n=1 Tax=Paenibacillus agaridevorans TaxID=171404 RepID=A0A2R5ENN6_9BACL|nr:hypothetical protein PAT3040_02868 [Paenibacillus agaridevorans]